MYNLSQVLRYVWSNPNSIQFLSAILSNFKKVFFQSIVREAASIGNHPKSVAKNSEKDRG